ncbi:hypothetical protein LOC54_06940 [Acetobacter sp. AN02]|uniref:hypothetical protein n=1 Tax=Acetobacter sp. AN02 TaxID=2894186 RepID=UPI0024342379|nr:hypothetical protein [Acetobacter sp. AN02]MDG6094847.1 hypothetical protein [Acetobacter sp. AN02]
MDAGELLQDRVASWFPATDTVGTLCGVIAVVGCDGSGKTRLAHDLVARLNRTRPSERRYMGLVSGETGDRIKKLPVIGTWLENYLARKVRRAQDMKKKVPGPFSAVVMYLFSLWRQFQLRRVIRASGNGTLIIAERYPQAEVPGFHYDGPGLDVNRSDNRLVQSLARREQKLYDWMSEQKPGLIIRLNVDPVTAHMRKPDHPLQELRDKTRALTGMQYKGARIYDIDAGQPYQAVLDEAVRIAERYSAANR